MESWELLSVIPDGTPLTLQGVNVWDLKWEAVKGEYARINDPLYGQPYKLQVWVIKAQNRTLRFAAGEFSNGVWGFYIPKD